MAKSPPTRGLHTKEIKERTIAVKKSGPLRSRRADHCGRQERTTAVERNFGRITLAEGSFGLTISVSFGVRERGESWEAPSLPSHSLPQCLAPSTPFLRSLCLGACLRQLRNDCPIEPSQTFTFPRKHLSKRKLHQEVYLFVVFVFAQTVMLESFAG